MDGKQTHMNNPNGITVAELKAFLLAWPDENEYGEPYEIWISTNGGVSSLAKEVWQLNVGDILVQS